MNACAECRNYQPLDSDVGECRASLPIAVDLHGDDPDSKQMDATWPVVESHMWCGRFRSSAWRGASETPLSLVRSVVGRLATQLHR